MSAYVEFSPAEWAAIVATLKATVAEREARAPEPRRPMSDDEIAYLSSQDDLAESRKQEREAGVSGPEADRAADREWDERGGF